MRTFVYSWRTQTTAKRTIKPEKFKFANVNTLTVEAMDINEWLNYKKTCQDHESAHQCKVLEGSTVFNNGIKEVR